MDKTNYTIDWLSASHWQLRDEFELRALAYELSGETVCKRTKPRHGYGMALADAHGIIYQSAGMPSMGTNVTLSGSALASLTSDNTKLEYLKYEILGAWRVSRLDLAIDVHVDRMTLLRDLIQRKEYACKARSVSVLTSGETGYTVYFGSRTSDKFMRIYDKQSESGTDYPWLRFELELKNDTAEQCARAIANFGIVPTLRTFFSEYLSIAIPEYIGAITGDKITYAPSQVKMRNTRDWLLGIVAKSMVRAMNEGDVDVFGDFCKRVSELIERQEL